MNSLWIVELLDRGLYEAGYEVQTVGAFSTQESAERVKDYFWHLITANTRFPGYRYKSAGNLKVRIREVPINSVIYFDKDPDSETFGQ